MTTAPKISAPPKIVFTPSFSPKIRKERRTVTKGSMVEIREALTGPIRFKPSRKVTEARMVGMSTIPKMIAQLLKPVGRIGLSIKIRKK